MTLISKLISAENTSLQASLSRRASAAKPLEAKSAPKELEQLSFLGGISLLFESLFNISPKSNEKEYFASKTQCIFNCTSFPSITIEDYLKRIEHYMRLPDEVYLLCLVYIDKVIQKTSLIVTYRNIHKLLLTSLTLACKFLDDDWESNDFMAKLGGIPTKELNSMEFQFLKDINYELFIDHKTLVFYQKHIKEYLSQCSKFASAQIIPSSVI